MLLHQKAADGNPNSTARLLAAPAAAGRHGGLALGDAAQPGPRRTDRRGTLPVAARRTARVRRLAAQRLLAGHVVGRRRRRRPPQAAVVRVARRLRRRLLTVQPRPDGLAVVACNDSDDPWSGSLVVERRRFDGRALASAALSLSVDARGTSAHDLPAEVISAQDPASEVLVVEGEDGTRALWWFVEDRDAALSPADLATRVAVVDGGYRVEVTTTSLVKDLALLADKVAPDAEVDTQLVTLLPGEAASFTVTTGAELDPEALTRPRVLRSANQLAGLTCVMSG